MKHFSICMILLVSTFPGIMLKMPEKCMFLQVFEYFCLKCALKVKVFACFCIKSALKLPHDCLTSASEVHILKMRVFLGQDRDFFRNWGTNETN
ncbi:hypothetical protein LJC19_06400 [Oxalobacter sp. OttesenSCG-928-P03]|nr:hypothetical protein [Oxalobacter sp. OttesenSCG-928-P03]